MLITLRLLLCTNVLNFIPSLFSLSFFLSFIFLSFVSFCVCIHASTACLCLPFSFLSTFLSGFFFLSDEFKETVAFAWQTGVKQKLTIFGPDNSVSIFASKIDEISREKGHLQVINYCRHWMFQGKYRREKVCSRLLRIQLLYLVSPQPISLYQVIDNFLKFLFLNWNVKKFVTSAIQVKRFSI